MNIEFMGLSDVNGPLIALDGVTDACYEEMVDITVGDNDHRVGRIIRIEGDKAIVQVFEGTEGISLTNTRTRLTGHPLELPVARDMLGRVFDGAGRPIDGLGDICPEKRIDVNGMAINPVSREYPRDYIRTGISSIDGLCTLIKGQKLPIFSGSGMSHNELAVQIVRQANISGGNYGIVFAAMGVKNDVADYFRRSFEETGVLSRVIMFLNLANDPIVERIMTPRCALTAAEHFAFEYGMDMLVIMTDMTSYAEALREVASAKGEIPGRKGYPGYLYSDLASLYERAGRIKGKSGSVTQLPILTMPNDDVTHPVPDLTGYITEGQIVLDRSLEMKGVYPSVSVQLSLSRLMKDGIGKGYTREDHTTLKPALRLLREGAGRESPRQRHRRRGPLPDRQAILRIRTPLRRRIPDAGQEREPHDRRNPRHRLEAPLDAPARRTRARLRRVLRQILQTPSQREQNPDS